MRKQGFWALPGLCLCLISCVLWCSCAVSRDGKQNAVQIKNYMLTVRMQTGEDEVNLMTVLADAGLMPELITRFTNTDTAGTSLSIKLRMHACDESGCEMLASRLRTFGIAIQNLQIERE